MRAPILWLACTATSLHAQSYERRADMIESFREYRSSHASLYQPPPITHFVPSFNTLTYALAVEQRDIAIKARTEDGELDPYAQDSMKLGGYTIAPHLALSLRKVGLGFSIENGFNSIDYQSRSADGASISGSQRSEVEHSGLGFNLSFLPFKKLSKDNKLAVIVGGKSLAAKHKLSYIEQGTVNDEQLHSIRYTIYKLEAGVNFNLKLHRYLRVIPWADYSYTHLKDAESAFDPQKHGSSLQRFYDDDLKLFWKPYPDFRYGIDLGVRISNFDIRIGSFLGSLALLSSRPDYIKDHSIQVSVSFDQNGG